MISSKSLSVYTAWANRTLLMYRSCSCMWNSNLHLTFKREGPIKLAAALPSNSLIGLEDFFGQLSLRQQEEGMWSDWFDQRDEAETKVHRTANHIEQLWRLLLVIEVAQVYRFQISFKASHYHPPLTAWFSAPPTSALCCSAPSSFAFNKVKGRGEKKSLKES